MKNGVCPKCGGRNVYRASDQGLEAGLHSDDGQMLMIHTKKPGIFGDDFAAHYLETYLCTNCGYLERYVEDLTGLEKVAGSVNWKKVSES